MGYYPYALYQQSSALPIATQQERRTQMAATSAGRKFLHECAERAVAISVYGQPGQTVNVVMSVLTDFANNELTKHLDQAFVMVVMLKAADERPEAVRDAIMDFAV